MARTLGEEVTLETWVHPKSSDRPPHQRHTGEADTGDGPMSLSAGPWQWQPQAPGRGFVSALAGLTVCMALGVSPLARSLGAHAQGP